MKTIFIVFVCVFGAIGLIYGAICIWYRVNKKWMFDFDYKSKFANDNEKYTYICKKTAKCCFENIVDEFIKKQKNNLLLNKYVCADIAYISAGIVAYDLKESGVYVSTVLPYLDYLDRCLKLKFNFDDDELKRIRSNRYYRFERLYPASRQEFVNQAIKLISNDIQYNKYIVFDDDTPTVIFKDFSFFVDTAVVTLLKNFDMRTISTIKRNMTI